MPRMLFKGGVWRNTEDEILKAAVMKYGKNQWARIASLLNRKSAKQVKARWYEWLDPSVKKTDWSREEDEKLLHMAKLMPTQWRTIAPIVGRTAAQCLERYEFLLDKAQARGSEITSNDPRKLRPGEIDPTPETKPARPDQIDLDEDEMEMLAEARARLANTQGKKAKRKGREKQMEEARRLATMQKRRELRAAGVPVRDFRRKSKYGMDYNKEIPFEKKPALGFYDTSNEKHDPGKLDFKKLRRQDLEKEPPSLVEERKRKEDAEKIEKRKKADMPGLIFSQSGGSEAPQRKRSKMILPTPQVDDDELDQVIKIGASAEAAKQMSQSTAGADLTADLVSEHHLGGVETPFGSTGTATPLRTPRNTSAGGKDTLMEKASALLARETAGTPLRPGSAMPGVEEKDHNGTKFQDAVVATPNTLLTTTRKDSLAINTPWNNTPGGETAYAQAAQKVAMVSSLASLPAPRNDFEVELGGDEGGAVHDQDQSSVREIDSEEAALEYARNMAELEARKWKSTCLKRTLPNPSFVNIASVRSLAGDATELHKAEYNIRQEMLTLLWRDAKPCKERSHWLTSNGFPDSATLQATDPTPEELTEASKLISAEANVVQQAMGHTITDSIYAHVWDECNAQVLWVPGEKRFVRASAANRKERIESVDKRLELNRNLMTTEAKSAAKIEKKLKTLLAGYQQRSANLIKQVNEATVALEAAKMEFNTLGQLRANEKLAAPQRLATIQEEISTQKEAETKLQKKFKNLTQEALDLGIQPEASKNSDLTVVHSEPMQHTDRFVKSVPSSVKTLGEVT